MTTWQKLKVWAKEKPDEVVIMGTFSIGLLASFAYLAWNKKEAPKQAAKLQKMIDDLEYAAALRSYIIESEGLISEKLG